ncbi:MAG: hypothetical protein K8J31_24235 [Anaerolineae bacterium]|nr:hypothetical protein [Anaerolineae bacterium]
MSKQTRSRSRPPRQSAQADQPTAIDPIKADHPVLRLQSLVGNQATQRVLQREGWSFSPVKPDIGLDPNSPGSFRNQYLKPRQRVELFLNSQTASLKQSPKKLLELVGLVRQGVPDAAEIGTAELQDIITSWAQPNAVAIQSPTSAQATPEEAGAAAASGLSLGVSPQVSKDDKGQVKVALRGSVEMLKKALKLEFEMTETPKLGFEIGAGDFKLGASMDQESWEFKLEYGEVEIPQLSNMSDMIYTSERALHEAISSSVTATLNSGQRPPQTEINAKVETAVGEKVQKIRQSVSAAKEGGAAKGTGFTIKLGLKGPTPGATHDDPTEAATTATINLVIPF